MASDSQARLLSMLRQAIVLSEKKYREMAAVLGWNTEKLARILKGTVELKLWDLVAILEAIGIPPYDFFAVAFPAPPDVKPARLREALAILYRAEPEESEGQGPGESDDIDRLVDALRERLKQTPGTPSTKPPRR